MTHIVVEVGATRFYALLRDAKGKAIDSEYFPHPEGGEVQRLRMSGMLLEPGNQVQVKQARGAWLAASIADVGEFTRSQMVQIDRSRRRAAIALKRELPSVLFVRRVPEEGEKSRG